MLADSDRALFASSLVKVGEFRRSPAHPSFENSGPTENYCFVFPRVACWIEHEGAPPFVADASVVPLYNPGRPYRRGVIHPDGDATDWFSVSPGILREMVAEYDRKAADADERLFPRGCVPASAAAFATQRIIFNHVALNRSPDALFVEESVVGLLGDVLDRAYRVSDDDRRQTNATLAARAQAHLGRTALRKESVGDVALAVGASPFHLCRVFRRETGLTLHRYRTELRLRWSLEPLADGVDILTVALDAGFSHHSHFTAAFRRSFGVSPSEFRRASGACHRLDRWTPLEIRNTRPE